MDCSILQKKPWNFGLMEYRCTPLTGNIRSPLKLLTGQKPRTSLPSMPQGNSATMEHCEALIKKQQMDISEELSISTYEPGQTTGSWNFPNELCVSFQVLNGLLNYIDTSDIRILWTITHIVTSPLSHNLISKKKKNSIQNIQLIY